MCWCNQLNLEFDDLRAKQTATWRVYWERCAHMWVLPCSENLRMNLSVYQRAEHGVGVVYFKDKRLAFTVQSVGHGEIDE